jgi:hypothetical protein
MMLHIYIDDEGRTRYEMCNFECFGYIIVHILNLILRKMQLTKTQLPDKRNYETYDSEAEKNRRFNELKNQ